MFVPDFICLEECLAIGKYSLGKNTGNIIPILLIFFGKIKVKRQNWTKNNFEFVREFGFDMSLKYCEVNDKG